MFEIFRKREKKPTPRWVIWMMIAVVGYALIANQQKGSDVNLAVERTKKNVERQFSKLGEVTEKVMPSMSATIRVNEIKLGEGNPAVCGQTATITYQAWLSEQQAVGDKSTADNPLSFTIGAGKVMPAFDRGVIGMQPGGRRSVFAAPELAYDAVGFSRDDVPKGATIKFDIDLINVEPALPDIEENAYRIIDMAPNTGKLILCGNLARAHVIVWSVSGKKLFSTKDNKSPIEFTPGKSEVFLGLEQGIIGMAPRTERTLIVPPAFQKTMRGNKSAIDFKLPKNETVLVEVMALP
ncbi:MAG: FKBP-type peptidyl-prolyl cis-trans isomerase [Rickettsiales bacterium]